MFLSFSSSSRKWLFEYAIKLLSALVAKRERNGSGKKNRNLHRFRVFIVLWMGLCSISNGKHINYSNPNEWARWEPTTSGKMDECLARISNSTAYMLLKYDVVESSSENEANSHVWRAKKHHIFLHDYYAASNMLHPSHNFFFHPQLHPKRQLADGNGIYSFLKCDSFDFVVFSFPACTSHIEKNAST